MVRASQETLDKAREEWSNLSARRAVEDPARLKKATLQVRAALAAGKLTLDDLTPLPDPEGLAEKYGIAETSPGIWQVFRGEAVRGHDGLIQMTRIGPDHGTYEDAFAWMDKTAGDQHGSA